MPKVGIVTIIDNNNYGNRLQNYALQETIKKMNLSVETIKNNKFFNSKVSPKKQVIYLKKYLGYIKKSVILENFFRKKRFKEFNKNIQFSKGHASGYRFKENKQYDYFIAGSDQVWKPTGLRLSDVTLLRFTEDYKKISYAASFGISDLAEDISSQTAEDFNKFKAISVREEKGKEIVEKITGRKDIKVLVDPTMLLNQTDWEKVIRKPKKMRNKKKYILNYFLGELSEERKNEIERIALENNCEIINILDKKNIFYKTGPSEFLYLEKNAFLICTDSFHSCVFAILFNKPFIIFDREGASVNMNSRIETLISKFELQDRTYRGVITNENLKHNYTKAYEILEGERKKSIEFLKRNLK